MKRLIQSLQTGATVVTATRRLARAVIGNYDAAQQQLGKRCWATAETLPWKSFIERTWNQCLDLGIAERPLLPSDWEQCLWEHVIVEESNPLLNGAATARDAIAAERCCVHYAIDTDALDRYASPETTAFRGWSQRVRERVSSSGLILHCDAEQRLVDGIRSDWRRLRSLLPQTLVMAGFEALTPLQQTLLQELRSRDINVSDWQPKSAVACRIVRHELPTPDAELRAAATWARHQLERNPNAKVGVVVTDLQQSQRRVEQIFEDCLHPRQLLPQQLSRPSISDSADVFPKAFNISLGSPLATLPIVSDALAGLALLAPRISVRTAGQLLRSVFFGDPDSGYSAAALLDAEQRRHSEPMTTLRALIAAAEDQPASQRPTAWIRRLRAIAEIVPPATRPLAGASTWANHFITVLRILEWPGQQRSNSTLWQAVNAAREVLVRFASFDRVLPPIAVDTALQQIRALLMDTVHQPRSEQQTPIQILGALETAGMTFDCLWITATDNEHWPGNVRSNPFLPVMLQRQAGVPDTDPIAVRQRAIATLNRLQGAAAEVVFSHALIVDDHEVLASPLVAAINVQTPTEPMPTAVEDQCWQQAASEGSLEAVDDPLPPPPHCDKQWRGVQLLQHQSQCPFKAFATHRLEATSVSAREHGWDGRERGQALHQLMDKIWQRLHNRSALDRIEAAALQELVADCAQQTLKNLRCRHPQTLTSGFLQLEHKRLSALALAWLEIERRRQPFTVKAREDSSTIQWPGLLIRIRPDRIDALDCGAVVVIDYKTAGGSLNDWEGDRPDDPQLPIYALAVAQQRERVAGVVFALLRRDQMRFCGISDEELSPGLQPPSAERSPQLMADTIAQWEQTLATLADNFVTGKREVDPKRGAQTCRYCDLSPLCRIAEIRAVAESSAK